MVEALPISDRAGRARPDYSVSVREETKCPAVTRANHREIAAVQGRHLFFFEPFAQRDDRRIDKAKVKIGVLALQLGGSHDVLLIESNKAICTCTEIFDEHTPRLVTQQLEHPVVDLNKDSHRYQEVFCHLIDHCHAWRVVGVG